MKKVLALALSLALIATLAISGTVAYLTDTAEDVNVMTLGNVKIEQHEYQRVEENGSYKTEEIDDQTSYVLEDFEQFKPLLPATESTNYGAGPWDDITVRMSQVDSYGGMQVFTSKNAQDKFVTVENTGKSDAYVRTIVAIEVGSADPALIGKSFHQTWTANNIGTFAIDGNKYYVTEYVYNGGALSDGSWRHENGILPAGDTTYPNLSQVYLKSTATNEDMEKIDGNGNGTLDILVLSQAVQAQGFENAESALTAGFGEVNAENVDKWFSGMKLSMSVDSEEELSDALAVGGNFALEGNITSDSLKVNADTTSTLNLNDNALTSNLVNEGTLTVTGGTLNSDKAGLENHGTATIENVTMNAGSAANYSNISYADSETTYTNVDITSNGGGIGATDGAEVTFNSGSVKVTATTTNPRYNIYAVGEGTEITINDGEFDFTVKTLKRAYIYAGAGATVYVNGGTFGTASTRSGYTDGILGDGTVIITGGTFGFDPTTWVANGYRAVQNGTTWTVVEAA